jgi:hypothetical protein
MARGYVTGAANGRQDRIGTRKEERVQRDKVHERIIRV